MNRKTTAAAFLSLCLCSGAFGQRSRDSSSERADRLGNYSHAEIIRILSDSEAASASLRASESKLACATQSLHDGVVNELTPAADRVREAAVDNAINLVCAASARTDVEMARLASEANAVISGRISDARANIRTHLHEPIKQELFVSQFNDLLVEKVSVRYGLDLAVAKQTYATKGLPGLHVMAFMSDLKKECAESKPGAVRTGADVTGCIAAAGAAIATRGNTWATGAAVAICTTAVCDIIGAIGDQANAVETERKEAEEDASGNSDGSGVKGGRDGATGGGKRDHDPNHGNDFGGPHGIHSPIG